MSNKAAAMLARDCLFKLSLNMSDVASVEFAHVSSRAWRDMVVSDAGSLSFQALGS